MNSIRFLRAAAAVAMAVATTSLVTSALANPLLLFSPRGPVTPAPAPVERALPYAADEGSDLSGLPARLKRQIVDYRTSEAPGTIIIDTSNTYLYVVLGNGRAMRYGIGVG